MIYYMKSKYKTAMRLKTGVEENRKEHTKRKLVQNVEGTDCFFTAEVPRQLCQRYIPRSFEDKRVARFEPFNPF